MEYISSIIGKQLKITIITNFYSMQTSMQTLEQPPINMPILQAKILQGMTHISMSATEKQAVLFIGDTGVGKSTLLAYLTGQAMTVEEIGLKACLTVSGACSNGIKIGHEKYSETSVPVKVVCSDITIYDCPGFNDNKSRQAQLANSFYYQRLLSLYERTKLVLIIQQSYLTECRAHRLPSLIRKLQQAFGCLDTVKSSVMLVVNKSDPDSELGDVERELRKVVGTKGMFTEGQVRFFQGLIGGQQVYSFKAPRRSDIGKKMGQEDRHKILQKITQLQFMAKKDITNIISDIAKLAIRDYLDIVTAESTKTVNSVMEKVKNVLFAAKTGLFLIKEQIIKIFQIKEYMAGRHDYGIFFEFCQARRITTQELQKFKSDLQIVEFFSKVYSKNKTESYYMNTLSLIFTNLSVILQKIDTMIQDQKLQAERKKRKEQRKREEQELKILEVRGKENKQNQPTIPVKKQQKKSISIAITQKPKLIPKQNQPPISSSTQNQPAVLAFQRKLMNAQLKVKQLSYGISQFHNKASYFNKTFQSASTNQKKLEFQ